MAVLAVETIVPSLAREPAPILLVDDRPANLLALTEILKEQGHPIVTATSGGEALRLLMERDFAVILLDVNMPGIDGFEVARLVRGRERFADTPIIFVTAVNVGDAFVTQGYSLGAVDYIFSPVVPEVLRAKVAVFLDLHEKRKGLERAAERLRDSLREKETLLREVHHRVKNNLQVISSLLNLHAQYLSEPSREVMEEAQNRVHAIALVHELLYQAGDLAHIDFGEYLESLVVHVVETWEGTDGEVSATVDAEGVVLAVDTAIPCGLIVNELVTNAMKHAFRGRDRGSIRISARRDADGQVLLRVEDDGVGLAAGADPQRPGSLGFDLVGTLAHQLHARMEIFRDPGTAFEIRFRDAKRHRT